MNEKDPKLIVLQFNECINNRDISTLSELMSDDYIFIDSTNRIHSNNSNAKEFGIQEWSNFFKKFPDYLNHFSIVESRENFVLIMGNSSCLYKPLDGAAIWTAKVKNNLISEWRVYIDNSENRKKLNLICAKTSRINQ